MNGNELREWRERLGWTQERAGKELGITSRAVQQYERGTRSDGAAVVIPRAIYLASLALKDSSGLWLHRPGPK